MRVGTILRRERGGTVFRRNAENAPAKRRGNRGYLSQIVLEVLRVAPMALTVVRIVTLLPYTRAVRLTEILRTAITTPPFPQNALLNRPLCCNSVGAAVAKTHYTVCNSDSQLQYVVILRLSK